jgi:hypothetical protein
VWADGRGLDVGEADHIDTGYGIYLHDLTTGTETPIRGRCM